ncbi:ODA11 [Symbiodinium natans]|uniref:ODA11 protein n=1 Tax=Symbiodinium natans TaxID=878477 RepID=A0A812NEV1_9DINO|nr:ODA11 [Symbiodinium natans]
MELYHWFYFRWRDGEVPLAEVDDSAQRRAVALLWCGLENAGCLKDAAQTEESIRGFMEMGCHIFWQQMVMIEAEIGLELSRRGNVRLSARVLRNASEHFSQMMRHPYFSRFPWQHPHDMNFNHEMFPSPGPVWPSKMLPIESWLEEHFAIFREELDALLQHAGLFDALHEAERNAEGQDHARDTDWTVLELADTREEEPWKLAACSQVPRTCRLLQSRPEFQCDHAAAYINRMRPGAWIKPHMGGPPRLVAHLGLDVPDAPIELYVGTAKLNWETGRAHVIDDTYPHSARYLGEHDEGEERYILHLLMCHPCEEQQRAAYTGQEQMCDPGAHDTSIRLRAWTAEILDVKMWGGHRSLRDTNVAKIEGDDLKIFMGLLADLFPGVQVPRARDYDFEQVCVEVMESDFGYTNDPDGYLLLKISQLIELLEIRHSVFLMGNPGSFKSFLWKVLKNAKTRVGDKTTVVDFSPKAITTNELYGSVNMYTREWKDGILSKTMRDLGPALHEQHQPARLVPDTHPKWIMLDGDLDANWIESMNSAAALAERFMSMLADHFAGRVTPDAYEDDLRDSGVILLDWQLQGARAEVCMSDKEGVQWQCYVNSWIKKCAYPEQLALLFDKYCSTTLAWIRKSAKIQVPYVEVALISALCSLLDARLPSHNLEAEAEVDLAVEAWFVFCTIFATGSSLAVDGIDYRKAFSTWWKNEMKTIKCLGFFCQSCAATAVQQTGATQSARLEEWGSLVEPLQCTEAQLPWGRPTTETVCLDYFMKALIEVNHPVMLIGLAGCGILLRISVLVCKTQSCTGLLKRLDHEVFMGYKMNMWSYYTDSTMLQTMMEIPLEKKAGKLYAPPGKLQLIYFIDDLNMPALDKYNTQSAIELIKQKQDYSHWYDRVKIQVKDIGGTQNPAARMGLFLSNNSNTDVLAGPAPFNSQNSHGLRSLKILTSIESARARRLAHLRLMINSRTGNAMQCNVPPGGLRNALNLIYSTFMKGHFDTLSFKVPVQEISNWVIKAALNFHTQVSATFRKTAQNMHYELQSECKSNRVTGQWCVTEDCLLMNPHISPHELAYSCCITECWQSKPSEFMDAEKLVLLWIHESERIYGDRLVSMADLRLRQLTEKIAKQMFSKHNLQKYFQEKNPEPIVFAPFSRASLTALCGHQNMDDGGVYDKIKALHHAANANPNLVEH